MSFPLRTALLAVAAVCLCLSGSVLAADAVTPVQKDRFPLIITIAGPGHVELGKKYAYDISVVNISRSIVPAIHVLTPDIVSATAKIVYSTPGFDNDPGDPSGHSRLWHLYKLKPNQPARFRLVLIPGDPGPKPPTAGPNDQAGICIGVLVTVDASPTGNQAGSCATYIKLKK